MTEDGIGARIMARTLSWLPPALIPRALRARLRREKVFVRIFETNRWRSPESASGSGSTLAQTEVVRAELPRIVADYGVHSLLDIPCGDFNWMREVDLDVDYNGADIVPHLVARNADAFKGRRRRFAVLDLVKGPLPRVDLVLCRDCLVHLSNQEVASAVESLRASGSTYLLTTTHTNVTENRDIRTGHFRAVNLQLPPFNFGPPLELINERCPEPGFSEKCLGLWKMAELPRLG
ncbi:MAG: class I SAM-dependent methyltransferase [Rhodobacteraceae bacterium]|nr:class I SAM-dependent methyltransferase [Paracoccaceae bacterium]